MDRVIRNTQAQVTLNVYGVDATLVDSEAPVTVTITDSAGAPVITGLATTHGGTGIYNATVPIANVQVLDIYTATWTVTLGGVVQFLTTEYEVVGGFLFSLGELRAFDAALSDVTRYPTIFLRMIRDVVEERFEKLVGAAMAPRGERETLDGDDTPTLLLAKFLPRLVVAGAEGGTSLTMTAYTPAQIANFQVKASSIVRKMDGTPFTNGFANVQLLYEHGHRQAPGPLKRVGLTWARELITEAPGPRRTVYESTEVGTIRYTLAGRDGRIGIPDVDAVLVDFAVRPPVKG